MNQEWSWVQDDFGITVFYKENARQQPIEADLITKQLNAVPELVEALRGMLAFHGQTQSAEGYTRQVLCECVVCENARALLARIVEV